MAKVSAVDVVVVDDDAESFLERCDQGHDRHRVEFGNGAEQVRLVREGARAAVQAEHVVQNVNNFLRDIHRRPSLHASDGF